MSIRLRLTAWYSGILAAVLIFWGVVIYAFVYLNTYQEVEQQLKVKSTRITEQIGVNPLSQSLDLDLFTESQLQEAQIYIQLWDYQSRSGIISGNMKKLQIQFPVLKPNEILEKRGISKIYVDGTPFLVNQLPFRFRVPMKYVEFFR